MAESTEMEGLDIKKIESETTQFQLRPYMKANLIPSFPCTVSMIGQTKSGKSTVLMNMLTNPSMYGKFFKPENMFLFSATGKTDGLWKDSMIPKKNVYTTEEQMIEMLDKLVEKQESLCEKDFKSAPRLCVIMEDLSAQTKLMRRKNFIKLYVQNRHIKTQVFACFHKYKSLTRLCRLQTSGIIFFPSSASDMNAIAEDHTPPNMSKKDFYELMHYAHRPTEQNPKPFLYINLQVPIPERFRKSFTEILRLN